MLTVPSCGRISRTSSRKSFEQRSSARIRRWNRHATGRHSSCRDWTCPILRYVGAFRGEPGLEGVEVRVGAHSGVRSIDVAGELRRFEEKLRTLVAELDALLPIGQEPDADQLAAIVDLCAWVHAEWVRIHPFANGNGRTARLWANCIAMRYGLPPFVRLRPRPNSGYGEAGAKAMQGDWRQTAAVFRQLLAVFLSEA